MKISYKPLWKTLIDKNWSKRELMRQANLTTNHLVLSEKLFPHLNEIDEQAQVEEIIFAELLYI